MPAGTLHQAEYISAGDISKVNEAVQYKPGELGQRCAQTPGEVYQKVVCDSGPASVAAGDVAFWKSRALYAVTNKLVDAEGGSRSEVAGIFTVIVTPGNATWIQTVGPSHVSVKTSGATAIGDWAVANSGASSDSVAVTQGTAPGYVPLGIYSSIAGSSLAKIELSVGAGDTQP